jgi:hypothetical protein
MDTESKIKFIVEDPAAGFVGLKPFAVEYELRNRSLADFPQDLSRRGRVRLDIDFRKGDAVRVKIALGFAAIPAPWSGVHKNLHPSILSSFSIFGPNRVPGAFVMTAKMSNTIQVMTADEIKRLLALEPHPVEGGHFRRTYTSTLAIDALRAGGFVTRPAATAIYYLLETGTFSEMHVLASDELFHFYLGDPMEMLQLWPSGETRVVTLGPDLAGGQHVQLLVPAGVWQGARLIGNGTVALLGCSVVPGFDFADYTRGSYAELAAEWPGEADRIRLLTRH